MRAASDTRISDLIATEDATTSTGKPGLNLVQFETHGLGAWLDGGRLQVTVFLKGFVQTGVTS